jgi:amino acid permease
MATAGLTGSEESDRLHNKSDIDTYAFDGEEHHHVVADKLARKLSARQVQMIAIGKLPFVTWHTTRL